MALNYIMIIMSSTKTYDIEVFCLHKLIYFSICIIVKKKTIFIIIVSNCNQFTVILVPIMKYGLHIINRFDTF